MAAEPGGESADREELNGKARESVGEIALDCNDALIAPPTALGLALSRPPGSIAHVDEDDDEVPGRRLSMPWPQMNLASGLELDASGAARRRGRVDAETKSSGRARDLISRGLLDELNDDMARNWREDGRHTPPMAGFDTPSDRRTPSIERSGMQTFSYKRQEASADRLVSIDQWDWKTDAPEFVPGCLQGLSAGSTSGTRPAVQGKLDGCGWLDSTDGEQRHMNGDIRASSNSGETGHMSQLRAQYEWKLRAKSDELRNLQTRINQLEIETNQLRSSWEIEKKNLARQIGRYKAVMEKHCIPLDEVNSPLIVEVEDEAQSNGARSECFGDLSAKPFGQAWGPSYSLGISVGVGSIGGWDHGTDDLNSGDGTLEVKMRRLGNLLQEEHQAATRRRGGAREPGLIGNSGSPNDVVGVGGAYGGSIVPTLRAMFPHATIRTTAADKDGVEVVGPLYRVQKLEPQPRPKTTATQGEGDRGNVKERSPSEGMSVQEHITFLEKMTNYEVDERALTSLDALSAKDAKEALQKVQELIDAQGGTCRNLSSILQSVCKKIEKKSGKWSKEEQKKNTATTSAVARLVSSGDSRLSGGPVVLRGGQSSAASTFRHARGDEGGDAFGSNSGSGSDGNVSKANLQRTVSQLTVDSKRSNISWADIHSGDEDDKEEAPTTRELVPEAPLDNGYWTAQRIEKIARRGFDVRRRGGDNWELKISMAAIDPLLNESGMAKYCKWLRNRLTAFQDENGVEPLRRCRGDIDFSHNKMSNQMVWMLLETLASLEVQAALVKFFGNHLSQGGVLAICEFIRLSMRTEAIQELHLSHNEIDDDSALELLRTLHQQRPKYPPKRPAEHSGEQVCAPVWLRLNHNMIRNPDAVRKAAEEEGITICTAHDRNACQTSKCCHPACPLVHLYSFHVQPRKRVEKCDDATLEAKPMAEVDEDSGARDRVQESGIASGESRRERRKRTRKNAGAGGFGGGSVSVPAEVDDSA